MKNMVFILWWCCVCVQSLINSQNINWNTFNCIKLSFEEHVIHLLNIQMTMNLRVVFSDISTVNNVFLIIHANSFQFKHSLYKFNCSISVKENNTQNTIFILNMYHAIAWIWCVHDCHEVSLHVYLVRKLIFWFLIHNQ